MELLERYQLAALDLIFKARTTQKEAVKKAGKIIADAVTQGHSIYLSGICHGIERDFYYRGGGVSFYQLYDKEKTELKPGDVLLVSSVSGRTESVVELAYNSMQIGVKVIAFTSMEYATVVEPIHSSGKKLYEFVTHVIDNCAPAAEAMLEVEGIEAKFAAASGFASDFLLWSITAVAVEEMLRKGYKPGIYKSHNFSGGPEYNDEITKHFEEFGW